MGTALAALLSFGLIAGLLISVDAFVNRRAR
jgi:hypothetical protein